MNDLHAFENVFGTLEPFAGTVEKGYLVDFLGVLTDASFRTIWGVDPEQTGGPTTTSLPRTAGGEGWFEAVNWVEAAREARERYVMVTLGACYGNQAVGAWKAVQLLNPMPCKLVAVEGDAENIAWTRKHFQDNGIDPDEHWIIEAALSASNEPVLFPVGSPGSGAQNCVNTNSPEMRMNIAESVTRSGQIDAMLYSILLKNSTGMKIDLVPDSDHDFKAELRYVSAITLKDVLGPFDRVDYVECDIQQSEAIVFPPAMEDVTRKVRRVHMGTHGRDVHAEMQAMFEYWGWDIVFSYRPNDRFQTPWGEFTTNDGVLTALNPRLARH